MIQQTAWKMPRKCFCCDNSIEKLRVVLTFPALPDTIISNFSFKRGQVIIFCVSCAAELFNVAVNIRQCKGGKL
jgi:hypothetical protein